MAIGTSSRPFQPGRAIGTYLGAPHSEPVDWLIDTGADWSALLPSTAANFSTFPAPANTAPPAGTAYRLASGIEVECTVNTWSGPVTQTASTPVIAIKARNVGSNLIGIPQLAAVNAEVRWNPSKQTGELCQ
jgi:hypothetical protein